MPITNMVQVAVIPDQKNVEFVRIDVSCPNKDEEKEILKDLKEKISTQNITDLVPLESDMTQGMFRVNLFLTVGELQEKFNALGITITKIFPEYHSGDKTPMAVLLGISNQNELTIRRAGS